jgi:hypothetical protein
MIIRGIALCLSAMLLLVCGCAGDVQENPLIAGSIDAVQSTASAERLRDIGDGLLARRLLIPTRFPEAALLIASGPNGAAAIVNEFQGQASADEDEALSILAFVLELIGDRSVVGPLADFLSNNLTSGVPATLSAVTHAIRVLEGVPAEPTAEYLISELEQTAADFQSASAKTTRAAQLITTKETCGREFYLLDANRNRIQDANGNDIRVGGTVFNPSVYEGFADTAPAMRLAARVREEGGMPFDYTAPESRVVFEGEPSRRFNCAGFAFRHFVEGRQWQAHPARMHEALVAAGLLVAVDESDAERDDFVFFSYDSGAIGHVAVVESVDNGISVINADGVTGMFRANVEAEWFQKYIGGRRYYRWANGPPLFEAVTERTEENSCFGTDVDGDGWPELVDCTSAENCIDPVIGGIQPTPGFRVWRVTNYGSAPGGYLAVLAADADDDPPLLSRFAGGGINPELRAVLSEVTDAFDTREAAVDSLCNRISGFFRPPLASFILQATFDGEVVSVDGIFQTRCPD